MHSFCSSINIKSEGFVESHTTSQSCASDDEHFTRESLPGDEHNMWTGRPISRSSRYVILDGYSFDLLEDSISKVVEDSEVAHHHPSDQAATTNIGMPNAQERSRQQRIWEEEEPRKENEARQSLSTVNDGRSNEIQVPPQSKSPDDDLATNATQERNKATELQEFRQSNTFDDPEDVLALSPPACRSIHRSGSDTMRFKVKVPCVISGGSLSRACVAESQASTPQAAETFSSSSHVRPEASASSKGNELSDPPASTPSRRRSPSTAGSTRPTGMHMAEDEASARHQSDEIFMREVLKSIQKVVGGRRSATWGYNNAERMLPLLRDCSLPARIGIDYMNLSQSDRQETPDRSYMVQIGTCEAYRPTSGQTPIEELLYTWWRDPEGELSVNLASQTITQQAAVLKTVGEIRQHFKSSHPEDGSPWNLLEAARPHLRSFLPPELQTWDCSFLKRLGDRAMMGQNLSRVEGERGDLSRFVGLQEWVLLAESGALTLPHQDSHGLSTWLMPVQGTVGFGWLANPNDEVLHKWYNNHHWIGDADSKERHWRYLVLRPGQWVTFPAGTIHFVFRLGSDDVQAGGGPTMMVGGHYIRWSRLDQWIKVIVEQLNHIDCTNESLMDIQKYLKPAAELINIEEEAGRLDDLGGKQAIDEFRRVYEEEDEFKAALEKARKDEQKYEAREKIAKKRRKRNGCPGAKARKKIKVEDENFTPQRSRSASRVKKGRRPVLTDSDRRSSSCIKSE